MTLEFLNLKKQNQIIINNTFNWIKTLTPELDFEDGKTFPTFVQGNLKLDYPCGVFILFDTESKEVIGISSIVSDDQNVGKEKELEGIWIAGINIKREHRGKGYGKTIFKEIDNYLSKQKLKPLRVNLFVNNPIALKLYKKFDFKQINQKVVRHEQEYIICSKFYE